MSKIEMLQANDTQAEMATLGGILIDNGVFSLVSQHISDRDFYDVRHAAIMRAMQRLAADGMPIDTVTLPRELKRENDLDMCGGLVYLIKLTESVGLSDSAPGYARIVGDMAYRRRLELAGQETMHLSRQQHMSLVDINDQVNALYGDLGGTGLQTFVSARAMFGDFVDDLNHAVMMAEAGTPDMGLSTGIQEWDHVFDGDFSPGVYNVMFGPTGIGKSWAGMQMAIEAADQCPVVYFTLENLIKFVRKRMVAVKSGIPFNFLRYGMRNGKPLETEYVTKAIQTASDMSDLPLDVVGGVSSIEEIRTHLKAATIRHGMPGICFVDTINELADAQVGKRYENLTYASALLLQTMRQTGWGIVAIAQLRLSLEAGMTNDAAKNAVWPTKHSLEGARTIGQHASNMIGIYSSDYVAHEIRNEHYEDKECPKGHALFVKVKGRETRGDTDGLVVWNPHIPRFETKKPPPVEFTQAAYSHEAMS